jgi:prephenate dehydrogenase
MGSTKERICTAMEGMPAQFGAIGGHPMCGKESSGLKAAEETLFRNQTFVLCRTARTTSGVEKLVLAMLNVIGAEPLFLDPAKHDRLVALVSHFPYFVAALLMEQAAHVAADEDELWSVSASGFRDTARLSGSEPQMLMDIVQTNRAPILRALRRHADDVEALIALLEGGEDDALCAWLQARQNEYRAYRRTSRAEST